MKRVLLFLSLMIFVMVTWHKIYINYYANYQHQYYIHRLSYYKEAVKLFQKCKPEITKIKSDSFYSYYLLAKSEESFADYIQDNQLHQLKEVANMWHKDLLDNYIVITKDFDILFCLKIYNSSPFFLPDFFNFYRHYIVFSSSDDIEYIISNVKSNERTIIDTKVIRIEKNWYYLIEEVISDY